MASQSQKQVLVLDRLANELLQQILDLAMTRDSPFYIDDPFPGVNRSLLHYRRSSRPPVLVSSTGAKDPLLTGHKGDSPVHQHAPQSVHRSDWIAVNSTSRRIRSLGKISFFRAKAIAMHQDLPARLQRGDFRAIKNMLPHDQALALFHIREIVIMDIRQTSPKAFLELPRSFAAFTCLRRCTLLFGFETRRGHEHDVEWITAAFVLSNPVPSEMYELMTKLGMPRSFRLEEALGPAGGTWADHWRHMADHIYPMMRIKGAMLKAKEKVGLPEF